MRDERLVAYVVAENGDPRRRQLDSWLRARLPEHVTPSLLVFLDDLPLLPNGKVDRAALARAPLDRPATAGAGFVAPRTAGEKTLAEIWAQILGIGAVGVHDNFFELGGHSLLATRMLSRMRQELRVELPLRSLFEGPTIAHLSRHLCRREPGSAGGTILDELEDGRL